LDATTILLQLFLGLLGFSFFIYGKKQKSLMPLISGVGLMVIPYFISNVWLLIVVGVVFVFLPKMVKF
jgi:hypothetical protein